jgi:competence protein ComEA
MGTCTATCLLVSVFAFSLTASYAGSQTSQGGTGAGLPEGQGRDVVVRVCGTCHEPIRAASVRLTRDGWADVIQQMKGRGARVTDEEFDVVLDYMAAHFLGEAARPLNVNTAEQIDLESVGGLLRREAKAVVDYRTEHGPFKTLDDMKNVPGLDFSKIDSRRDYLVAF